MRKRNRNTLKWILGLLLVGLAGFWIWAQGVGFRLSDDEIRELFVRSKTPPRIFRYTKDSHQIRYTEFGNDSLPVVIMVHGAPSSLSFFSRFYEDSVLLSKSMLVGVDRPGYGYSDFGRSVISIKKQGELLQPLIEKYTANGRKVILAASSYGGSVVARLAMQNPDKVSGILFVSSSFQPGQEEIYAVTYLIESPWFRWFFPTMIQVAADEKLAHRNALEEIQDGWDKIQSKIILLHGLSDGLIYFSNAEYAKNRLINAHSVELVPLKDIGHSIFFDRPEVVKSNLLKLISETN